MWTIGWKIFMIENKLSKFIKSKIKIIPKVAIILGSGLGGFTKKMVNKITISYTDIPNYPKSTIKGHDGEFIFGFLNDLPIICASGRFHYYEGYDIKTVSLPVRVLKNLKCDNIIITGAAGCLNKYWDLGTLMLISGYIDCSYLKTNNKPKIIHIDKKDNYLKKIEKILIHNNIRYKKGIYSWTIGPNYETHAEIKEIINIGGDAIGMSTVPEIMESIKEKMNIIGISCLTNYGAGLTKNSPSHKKVLVESKKALLDFSVMLTTILKNYKH